MSRVSVHRDLKRATSHLRHSDDRLADVIRRVGVCGLTRRGGTFSLLAESILSQQISTHAARTIRRRLRATMPSRRITPAGLLDLTDQQFKAAGVSPQKRGYMIDLATKTQDRTVSFRRLSRAGDEDVIRELTAVKGVGRWTAQMFLLAGLGRPDIFATADLGLQNAIQRIYGFNERPTPDEMEEVALPWQPYRSVASWYLWRSLDL